jgi:hypothetical protein
MNHKKRERLETERERDSKIEEEEASASSIHRRARQHDPGRFDLEWNYSVNNIYTYIEIYHFVTLPAVALICEEATQEGENGRKPEIRFNHLSVSSRDVQSTVLLL